MLQETASTKLMVAKAGIKCTLCLLSILFVFLPPSQVYPKIYLTQNPPSKEGEKVDLVPCYNTIAGQGRAEIFMEHMKTMAVRLERFFQVDVFVITRVVCIQQ